MVVKIKRGKPYDFYSSQYVYSVSSKTIKIGFITELTSRKALIVAKEKAADFDAYYSFSELLKSQKVFIIFNLFLAFIVILIDVLVYAAIKHTVGHFSALHAGFMFVISVPFVTLFCYFAFTLRKNYKKIVSGGINNGEFGAVSLRVTKKLFDNLSFPEITQPDQDGYLNVQYKDVDYIEVHPKIGHGDSSYAPRILIILKDNSRLMIMSYVLTSHEEEHFLHRLSAETGQKVYLYF